MSLEKFLQDNYGFSNFRPGQKEVIETLVAQTSLLAILPTGNGKSLCYQFIGKYLHIRTLIISPLLSLMQDQVSQMHFQGEKKAIAITSELSFEDKKKIIKNLDEYMYIFVAPEMLQRPDLKEKLQKIAIGLLVIDEAHCISQWGPDFRPDYLDLGNIKKMLANPLTLALTATATPTVQKDICQQLGLKKVYHRSVDRPNIYLGVLIVNDALEKKEELLKLVEKLCGPGLIYFSSKKMADDVSIWLNEKSQLRVAAYHANLALSERYKVQRQFINDELDIVCATSAFGMGINKANIRYVIHYHLPADLGSYLQEIGRAGRDDKQSCAILLYQKGDENIQRRLAENTLPSEREVKQYFMIKQRENHKVIGAVTEQALLIDKFKKMGFTQEKLVSFWQRRKEEKRQALLAMIKYATTKACKRQFILNYFSEETQVVHNDTNCCNLNDETFPLKSLGLFRKKMIDQVDNRKDYHEILKELFNVGN